MAGLDPTLLKNGQKLSPEQAMELAFNLARKGLASVSPNPPVGCVILDRDGRLIGKGHHLKAGEAHAEVNAINSIENKQSLEGAHIFITLEPCSFEGRTPACAKQLAQLPLGSVNFPIEDPHPSVSGQGSAIIREAGIKVVQSKAFEAEAAELIEVFALNQKYKRAFVAIKVACTLDGVVALKSGQSQWITGEQAREKGHELRAIYDSILVGKGTFETDQPRLNVRSGKYPDAQNHAIILDPKAELKDKISRSSLVDSHGRDRTWLVHNETLAIEGDCFQGIGLPANRQGELDLLELSVRAYQRGICSILVEGGPATWGSFFKSGLVDRYHFFFSPSIIGSQNGIHFAEFLNSDDLDQRLWLQSPQVEKVGEDVYLSAPGRIFETPSVGG